MKICGIVLNYFSYEDTITCVQTLVDQNELKKIIIVENSANNAELRVLKDVFKDNRQVEILAPSQNLGFSGGVNLALNSAIDSCVDAFLLLNNDTLIPQDTVKKLASGLIDNDFDMASPIIYCYPEKHKVWVKGYYYNRFGGLITQRNISFIPGTIFFLSGCCILIHRKIFKDIGLLNTSFFMYGEDVEFCFRAVQKGFRIGFVDKAHIYHKANASTRHNSFFYEYHIARAHFLLSFCILDHPLKTLLSLLGKSITLTARAFVRSLRYHNLNPLIALLLAPIPLQIRPKRFKHDTFKKNLKKREKHGEIGRCR
ncbi:MAG: glycosyltransferase family 2 protein [Deltaproteobacteria bacterium]|nr:glycosyltransferase family 2 protein [Deltaproteobacteria bacterium]